MKSWQNPQCHEIWFYKSLFEVEFSKKETTKQRRLHITPPPQKKKKKEEKCYLEWDYPASGISPGAYFDHKDCTWDWICQSDEMCSCLHERPKDQHWGHICSKKKLWKLLLQLITSQIQLKIINSSRNYKEVPYPFKSRLSKTSFKVRYVPSRNITTWIKLKLYKVFYKHAMYISFLIYSSHDNCNQKHIT